MDILIKKANFVHDNEEEHEKFTDEVREWTSSNEETCSSADGIKALKALGDALSGKKIPLHDTEGWKQAVSAYESVENVTCHLKDAGKMSEKDLREAFFNFVLQITSNNLASIHLHIIKEVIQESDIGLGENIKTLPTEKVKLLIDICKKNPVEQPGKNEEIYEKFYYAVREISDALSKEQTQEFEAQLMECALHFLLDFTHLDEDSLEHMVDASSRIVRNMDEPWEKVTNFAFVKGHISKLQGYFARSLNTPEKLERPIREFIRDMRSSLAKRDLVELASDFHDLAMAVSKSKMKYNTFLKDCFDYSILYFHNLSDESLKKNSALFIDLLHKFKAGLNEISKEFLEDYPLRVVDALKHMFPKNKQHSEQWFQLLLPLLKLPYVSSMDAAYGIVDAANGMEWKGKSDLAEQVFKAAELVKTPEFTHITDAKRREKEKNSFVKYYKYFLKDFMEGLKRGKIVSIFGTQALRLCTNMLKMSSDFQELQELVEDVSEKIDINVKDPESKKAMVETMEAIREMCANPDYPWVDCWNFKRAVKELVRSCVRPINDPRVLTDKDLVVYISVCEETLRHDVLDPETGQYCSQHYTVFTEVMDGLSNWLKALDKYGLAVSLFEQIMTTYDTEETTVAALNSRYLGDASQAPSGLKLLGPNLDRLFVLLVETEDESLARTLMQAYPANPKSIVKHMPALMDLFMKSIDDSMISYFSMMLNQVTKSAPEAFTKENTKQLMDKCQEQTMQTSILQVVQELCKRRPEIMVNHASTLMNKSKWQPMLKSWINDMIATLALYDEKLAPKALDYMLEEARVDQEKSNLLTSLNAARQIGFKYKDLIKARRDKVEQFQFSDPDAQNLKQIILDMIDGKTSEEMMKQFEEQQANIAGLVGRVDETQEAVAEMKEEMDKQGQDLNTVKKDVNLHGHRLDQVEETVEETVAKVEEIDQKTLSYSPYWSRDVAKLLNPATDHDWRLLSSRLGYSNDDIRAWAQQADPCMSMLNEWYATRKTSEATYAILTQLQEMNRQDAAIIVENAMKNAEAVVEDEDFEYASPPPVFISYQWGHQPEARLLQKHLEMAGYQCWLDLGQMGGGDKLFEKIDSGIRAAKVVISCVTDKYAKSPNCNREVNLSVNLKKAMIPLLMEKCTWPPPGSMGPIFSEYLFIRFYQRGGEELPDERYWPEDKFQELLMQLDGMGLAPDATQIDPVYKDWWMPKVQEIKIDKSKTKDGGNGPKTDTADIDKKAATSPDVFISYQWGKQKNIIQLYERLTGLGLTCWLDIKQMGGGDSLYDKIDRGVRGCQVVVSCVTQKYALSANCRREVSLADALKKPLVPILLESMQWPPSGPMSMAFTQLLYIDFTKNESEQMSWKGVKSQELIDKLNQHVPMIDQPRDSGSANSKTGGHIHKTESFSKDTKHGTIQVVNQKVKTPEVNEYSEEERQNNKDEGAKKDKQKHDNEKQNSPEKKLVEETKDKRPNKMEHPNDEDQVEDFQVIQAEDFKRTHEPKAEEKQVLTNVNRKNKRLKENEDLDKNSSDKENQENEKQKTSEDKHVNGETKGKRPLAMEHPNDKDQVEDSRVIQAEKFKHTHEPKAEENQDLTKVNRKNGNGKLKERKDLDKNSNAKENKKIVNLHDRSLDESAHVKANRKRAKNLDQKEIEKRKLELKREEEKEQYKKKWEEERNKIFKQKEIIREKERRSEVEKRRLERRKQFEKEQKNIEQDSAMKDDHKLNTNESNADAVVRDTVIGFRTLSETSTDRPKQEKRRKPLPPPSQLAAMKQRNYPPYLNEISTGKNLKKLEPQTNSDKNNFLRNSDEMKPQNKFGQSHTPNERQNYGTINNANIETLTDNGMEHLKNSNPSKDSEKFRKRSPRPPPSEQSKASRVDPFSYQALMKAKKGPSPKPRQPASGEPTSNPQDQQQKKDQETKPNPREQQQKPNTKPTPAQQQQQQNQPASALQQKEQAQHMPAQKQPPTSNSTPNQSAPENPKKSKSCAII